MSLNMLLGTNVFLRTFLFFILIINSKACHQFCFPQGCQCCPIWNAFECDSCMLGYYRAGANCTKCSLVTANCSTCSNSAVCLSCFSGSYLDSSHICIICSASLSNCLACTSATTCTECQSTHYLGSASNCTPCSAAMSLCATCTGYNACSSCLNSSYVVTSSGNGCDPCSNYIPNCLQCSSRISCTVCSGVNMVFVQPLMSCISCSSLIPNCTSCTSQRSCTNCLDASYSYDPIVNQCLHCLSTLLLCTSCTASTACTTCNAGISALKPSSLCDYCKNLLPGCITCTSSANCNNCEPGYFLSAGICSSCYAANQGCISCVTNTACLTCAPPFFLNGAAKCQHCGSVINNCTECNDAIKCIKCQNGIYLVNSTDLCQPCGNIVPLCSVCETNTTCLYCVISYFKNAAKQCQACGSYIPFCTICQTPYFCFQCTNDQRAFRSSSTTCELCSTLITNCTNCLSDTTCTICAVSPYIMITSIGTCIYCLQLIPYCLECSTFMYCTRCDPTHSLQISVNIRCALCMQNMFGCHLCQSDTVCTRCFYGNVVTNGCSPVVGCIEVTPFQGSSTTCTLCNETKFYRDPVNGLCKCKVGFLSGHVCTTLAGCTAVALNGSKHYCQACDSKGLFLLANSTCHCSRGYKVNEWKCIEICGDGLLFILQCDDGNLQEGDGCSSSCNIQFGYRCNQGTPYSPSICAYQGALTLQYVCIQKNGLNAAQMQLKTNPIVSNIGRMNLKSYLTLQSTQRIRFTTIFYSKGLITANFVYGEDVEGIQVKVNLNFDQRYIRSPNTTIAINIIQCNKNFLLYSPSSLSSYNDLIISIAKYQGYAAILFLVLGSFSHRMIGVQTINTIQFSIVFLSFAQYHLPNYDYLSNLRSTLNINNSLYFSNQTALKHKQLFRLNYVGSFINNTLVAGGIAFVFILIFIALGLYQKFGIAKSKGVNYKKNRLVIVKTKIYGFIIFPFLIGFFVNTYISLIIYCLRKYQKANSNKWIECITILTVISSTMIVYFKQWGRMFIGNDILHRQLRCSKKYIPIYLTYLLLLSFILIASLQDYLTNQHLIMFLLFLMSAYLLFLFIIKPYQNIIHHIGLILNQIGLIFILSVLFKQKPGDQNEILYVFAIQIWICAVLIWGIVRTVIQLRRTYYQRTSEIKSELKYQDQQIVQSKQEQSFEINHLTPKNLARGRYFQNSLNVNSSQKKQTFKKLFENSNIPQRTDSVHDADKYILLKQKILKEILI